VKARISKQNGPLGTAFALVSTITSEIGYTFHGLENKVGLGLVAGVADAESAGFAQI
jgi:hypothetical protein